VHSRIDTAFVRRSTMSIQPQGESLRRAVRFVSEKLQEDRDQPLPPIVNEAISKFDLNPSQAEYLTRFYRDAARLGRTDEG
jgi:hypothetical protein